MERNGDLWLAAVVFCGGVSLCQGAAGSVADEAVARGAASAGEVQAAAESAGTLVLLTTGPIRLSESQVRQAALRIWPGAALRISRRPSADVEGLSGERKAGEVLIVEAGSRWLSLSLKGEPFVTADEIAATEDATVRRVLEQHRGYLTISGGGADPGKSATAEDCAQLLAVLLEQGVLADGRVCGLMVPSDETILPWGQIQAEVVSLLRSKNPTEELRSRMNAPVLSAGQHAGAVQRAAEQARAAWAEFAGAYRSRGASGTAGHSILAEFSEGTVRELIWLEVQGLRDGRVFGRLANRPLNLRGLQEGASVEVAESEVLDWVYVDAGGQALRGAFLSRQLARERPAASVDRAGTAQAVQR